MRRHRPVPLAPKVPADRNEADVGRCTRVAVDLKVAVYIAKVGFAGARIVGALEITPDLDAGADKAALLRALPDPDVPGHRHAAFEERKRAVIGVEIAVDRRRLLRCIDSETGILPNVHVPRDGCVGERARRAVGHDDVAIDRSG